jgi:hypothetical protein
MTDPLLEALAAANPASPPEFADLPPLRLPGPARQRAVPLALAALLAVAGLAGVALEPSAAPRASQVLERALADGGGVLHWRVSSGATEDIWMHVGASGVVDTVRELRLDGPYAGMESVISQPHGLGNLASAITRTRARPGAPIRTGSGIGFDTGFTDVVAAAQRAARGELDLGDARASSFAGRDAYAIRLPDVPGPYLGTGPATFYAVTMWVDRETAQPLAVRWAHGDHVWRTIQVLAYQRLPDDPRYLEFGP